MSTDIILVGIDYSDPSKIALSTAASIARAANGILHVAHVIAPTLGTYPSDGSLTAGVYPKSDENYFVEWLAKVGEDTRQRLPRFCAELAGDMLEKTSGHVRVGHPDRELVQLAEELKADLLVVGTHGRSGFERMFLGSVAEHVVRSAPCPVLVARSRDASAEALIDSPCAACLEIRQGSASAQTSCARHSKRHPRAHTYTEYPEAFGLGSISFRF